MNLLKLPVPRDPYAGNRGFTLVELMVTTSVLVILLAMAVPSFTQMIGSNRLATQTNELVASLNLARMEAIRRGQNVAIRSGSTTSAGADFSSGWTIFLDSDSDGTLASESDVLRVGQVPAGRTAITRVKQSGGAYVTSDEGDKAYLVFTSRGAKSNGGAAFFKVCDSGNAAIPGRVVRVLNAGTISLVSSTETCS